jgi:hypothetical protein
MAWGTNKFLKKLLKPNVINNNELADFISRVPDNEELVSVVSLVFLFVFLVPNTDEVTCCVLVLVSIWYCWWRLSDVL